MIARPLYHALAALVVIDLLWLAISPLRLSTDSFVQLAQLLPLAIAAGWASLQFRRWHRFSLLCEGAAFMLLAWPALRLFNHLSMTTAFPLADASLAWGDQLIGFDWLAYLLWFDRYPLLLKAMELFYVSLSTYSAAFFLVILAVSRDPAPVAVNSSPCSLRRPSSAVLPASSFRPSRPQSIMRRRRTSSRSSIP